MAKCVKCGKSGPFVRVDKDGLCASCQPATALTHSAPKPAKPTKPAKPVKYKKCVVCGKKKGFSNNLDNEGLCWECRIKKTLDEIRSQYPQFKADREIKQNLESGGLFYLALDDRVKKVVLSTVHLILNTATTRIFVFDYSDINDIEVQKDGVSITSGNAGKAIAGGLLFGAAGAVVGASAKRKTASETTRIEMIVHLNTIQNPSVTVVFKRPPLSFENAPYETKGGDGKALAQEAYNLLIYAKNNAPRQNTTEATGQQSSVADEILKYKNLLDLGAITEDEFEAKKKQLLDL